MVPVLKTRSEYYNPVIRSRTRVLMPELLLNNESLIKVDTEEKHNYLKITEGGKVKYVLISSEKKGEGLADAFAIPINDSPYLLPVNIKNGTNKQFWITVKVPQDAEAGDYTSHIKFKTGKKAIGTLTLKLKVLPFKLSEPYYTSSIYYWNPRGPLYKDTFLRQFKKEMENMYAHGVTNPVVFGEIDLLDDLLRVRSEVGMNGKEIFYYGLVTENPHTGEELKLLSDKVKKAIEIAKPYGIEDVYVYGIDESLTIRKSLGHKDEWDSIARCLSQRAAWWIVHDAGGKVFVPGLGMGLVPEDERRRGNFGFMGDVQDLMLAQGYPNRGEAASWHGNGHKVFSYGNPQGGVEQPDVYRRNFGLLLWQTDYDGALTYNYHWNWGDFCLPSYKQLNMVYATVDGVIDTTQWEGYREGVDDVRYVTTLLEFTEKGERSEDKKTKAIVREARDFLRRLKESDVNKTKKDLDVVRSQMVEHIIKLIGATK